ncbi:MAG TPA: asparagine--tRNA ligase, partial [Parachlamydiales bacterium]|nr:asparagine--tRNA ligase [Parachlamydiales bacterium]
MKRTKIKEISENLFGNSIKVCGWVRTVRAQKNFSFIELVDGSTFHPLQIVADPSYELTIGSSIAAEGVLVESPGANQKWELKAEKITL